jgi:NIMA (never in mitosis gene a)-related kinase 1/4/5
LKPPFRARDMEGLYRKVTRGYYTRIDKVYSEDLVHALTLLIRVKPSERLSCVEILDDFIIRKHMRKSKDIQVEERSILLKTIKISKNINYLTERLPKANYSPLKYKSLSKNHSSMDMPRNRSLLNRSTIKNSSNLDLSLPPIKNSKRVPVLKASMISPKKESSLISPRKEKYDTRETK